MNNEMNLNEMEQVSGGNIFDTLRKLVQQIFKAPPKEKDQKFIPEYPVASDR